MKTMTQEDVDNFEASDDGRYYFTECSFVDRIVLPDKSVISKCIIGKGSTIGNDTEISDTVVGKDATVGEGSVIKENNRFDPNCLFSGCVVLENGGISY